jgi:Na+/melibiose symporter-like transporter
VLILVTYPSVFYLTTVLVYLLAFVSIRRKHLSLETDTSKSEIIRQMIKLRLRNKNRFLTTVLIVNIILIFGMISTLIVWPLKDMVGEGTLSATTVAILFHTADISFLINLASNPFLYIWRLPKYRKTFFNMYCCKK